MANRRRRSRRVYAHCRCGKFKSCPSAVCGWCGRDPVPYGWNRALYDRERDWPYWPGYGLAA